MNNQLSVYGITILLLSITYVAASLKSKTDSRIVGGKAISIESAPWQVSVRLKALEKNMYGAGHICGGSVISQRFVVTAAHCIINENRKPVSYRTAREFTLVMGSTYLTFPTRYTLQYDVLQIIMNANFDMKTFANDIALFLLNGFVPWNWPTVSAISLNTIAEPVGVTCTVTGWGSTGYNYISDVLVEATVPIVDYGHCETNYGNISTDVLCAGYMHYGGVDACQGDSGGPLVCNGFLVGIVSWGYGCALPGYPGIYTNVSFYNSWIVAHTNSFICSFYDDSKSSLNSTKFSTFLLPLIILTLEKINTFMTNS